MWDRRQSEFLDVQPRCVYEERTHSAGGDVPLAAAVRYTLIQVIGDACRRSTLIMMLPDAVVATGQRAPGSRRAEGQFAGHAIALVVKRGYSASSVSGTIAGT
jgi:hypothetical protein